MLTRLTSSWLGPLGGDDTKPAPNAVIIAALRLFYRLIFAALLIVGLSAVTLFLLWATRHHIRHPQEVGAGPGVDLKTILRFYGQLDEPETLAFGGLGTYYAYVIPLWFLLVVFVYIPPILPPLFSHPARREQWRIWFAGFALIVLATMWGMGDTALFRWLYERSALLREWRFQGRALAVGAFWIGVLVAMRVDALVQFTAHPTIWRRSGRGIMLVPAALVLTLSWTAWHAAGQVIAQWGHFGLTEPVSSDDETCVGWLRAQYPSEPLTVYRYDYDAVYTYIDNDVRKSNIGAAYMALPLLSRFPHIELRATLPQYAIALTDGARNYLDEAGFLPIKGSPELSTDKPCVYIQGNAYPYAFAMRADFVQQGGISPSTVIALPVLDRKPDIITLQVESTPKGSVIVAVDELAFPGWQGRIDGEPAPVESIGGLIGVILPPGFGTHTVVFQFRPPLFVYSAWLTLLTIAFIVLYLLRAERLVRC